MTRNSHDMALDHHGTAVAEEIATGTATAGYAPLSAGPGLPAAWGAVSGGGGGGVTDLLTGNDSEFTSSVGNWTSSGGTLTRDTGASYFLPGLSATLKFVTTATGQHIEVPVAGTFAAGQEYQALLYLMHEWADSPSGLSYQVDFGLIGTDAVSVSATGLGKEFFSNPNIPFFVGVLVRWVPSAARTGVTLRFSRPGAETGTVNWHVGWARAAAVGRNGAGLASVQIPNGAADEVHMASRPTDAFSFPATIMQGYSGPGLSVGPFSAQVASNMAGFGAFDNSTAPTTNSVAQAWGQHTPGDRVQQGVEVSVGSGYLGVFFGQKDATTVQVYPDYGDYTVELAEASGGTRHWEFRAQDDGIAIPALGRLPVYAADPGSPVEGQMYYNSATHKARCYNGTSWFDLF